MQTHQRPKSISLRKVTKHAAGQDMTPIKYTSRYMLNGGMIQFVDYGWDVGTAHILDYWLHRATRNLSSLSPRAMCLPKIGRYLDGEEEREGTYR
jgi:hypothetical protein